jgi:rhamnosyltransferase
MIENDFRPPQMVCAVVTTFRPTVDIITGIRAIRHQVQTVLIVDDGGLAENQDKLATWFKDDPGIVLLRHATNRGIAAALNTGLTAAKRLGFSHTVLLDDDSVASPSLVAELMSVYNSASMTGRVIVGSATGKDNEADKTKATPRVLRVSTIITAGSLLPIDVFDQIGPFREEFFIDFVDHEYSLRARAQGIRILVCGAATIKQPIGRKQMTPFGELKSVHSPDRTYYYFRNSSTAVREYGLRFPLFAAWVIWQQVKLLVKIVLFLGRRKKYIQMVLRGWRDSMARRFGPISSAANE